MHPEVLAPETARAYRKLSQTDWVRQFYLGGGTAVALQLGHRRSVDLDFFSTKSFDTLWLRQQLADCGTFQLDVESPGTLHGQLDDAKLSFLEYRYPLIENFDEHEGITIASLKDLACMKLEVIAARGKKRDLIDLYAILKQGYALTDILIWFENKYQSIQYNQMHLIKSLTYFADAEADPMPMMLEEISWEDVKRSLERETKKLIQ